MKVAKLVTVNMTVRVIVEDTASDEDVIQRSVMGFKYLVGESLEAHVSSVEPDVENPCGTYTTDSN